MAIVLSLAETRLAAPPRVLPPPVWAHPAIPGVPLATERDTGPVWAGSASKHAGSGGCRPPPPSWPSHAGRRRRLCRAHAILERLDWRHQVATRLLPTQQRHDQRSNTPELKRRHSRRTPLRHEPPSALSSIPRPPLFYLRSIPSCLPLPLPPRCFPSPLFPPRVACGPRRPSSPPLAALNTHVAPPPCAFGLPWRSRCRWRQLPSARAVASGTLLAKPPV